MKNQLKNNRNLLIPRNLLDFSPPADPSRDLPASRSHHRPPLALAAAAKNASNPLSMAVTLDACATPSDSLNRFAAYASVIWGAQAMRTTALVAVVAMVAAVMLMASTAAAIVAMIVMSVSHPARATHMALEHDEPPQYIDRPPTRRVPQALWWEGVGRCASIGTDRFSLIAAINTRLVSWVEPLFLKGPDGVNPVPRYRIKVSLD